MAVKELGPVVGVCSGAGHCKKGLSADESGAWSEVTEVGGAVGGAALPHPRPTSTTPWIPPLRLSLILHFYSAYIRRNE